MGVQGMTDASEAANRGPRLRPSHVLLGLIGGVVLLLLIALWIWWGALREGLMDPATPYQTYTPPPAPDYAQSEAWSLAPQGNDRREADEAAADDAPDIFFIAPTTYEGRQWNAPLHDAFADDLLRRVMLPNYAGPFEPVGRIFAPRYRQGSLYTQITLREDARDARAFAYNDVRRAFDYFLTHMSDDRPLIVVGVEQGGVLGARLIREELSQRPELKDRLAAVYLLETPVPKRVFSDRAPIGLCVSRDQAGCVVVYFSSAPGENDRTHDHLKHAPTWRGEILRPIDEDEPLACVNPALGAATEQASTAQANLGGADAAGLEWGEQPGILSHQVSAQCRDGLLQVSRPRAPSLRGHRSWVERERVRPYNWFYADLTADAEARVAALREKMAAAAD